MLSWLLSRLAGDYNARIISKLDPLVRQINILYAEYNWLSDAEIQAKTQEFRDRYTAGATLDELLCEAFAIVKQACKRLVGTTADVKWSIQTRDMIPYDSQLIGGIILHQWKIAEMKTGEGKTLVAALPVYLNALTGKWVHVVSVNDYLSSRDALRMWHLYTRLWLSVWCVIKSTPLHTRREEYSKDITYVENSELWFDYLRDNLATSLDQRNMLWRPMYFAIVDEVDSILIDEARTPLIISQPHTEATEKYLVYAKLVTSLAPCSGKKKISKWFLKEILDDHKEKSQEDWDYYVDEKTKTVSLSNTGIKKLETILGVENIYKEFWHEEIHHIENALRAQAVYHNNKDYIVVNGEVLIVDEHTGRTMPGRRYSDGLHQAIEAKESVTIQREAKTLATITYQNFFKQYTKIAGMTGTATTEWEEFEKIYNLEVIAIPTNKKIIRVDLNDKVYYDQSIKWKFVMDYIAFYHEIWQPILIGTSSIHTSELVSTLLNKKNFKHYVLNAKFHEQEATIISQAGKLSSIVVATNMAGRGTDIKLDKDLNIQLASRYASWATKILLWDTYASRDPQWLVITVHSEIESDLTLNALTKELSLSSDLIVQSQKQPIHITFSTDQEYQISIVFNKKHKTSIDRYTRIMIKPINKSWINQYTWVIEKTFYYWLFILGTEKHDSRRIDNQLRGRAGRQGDPGVSCFFVAFDDEIMRKMWWDTIKSAASLLGSKELQTLEFTQKSFTSSIARAQKQMEARHFGIRKHLFDYDSVIDKQRQKMYNKRDQILYLESTPEQEHMLVQELHNFIPQISSISLKQAQALWLSDQEFVDYLSNEYQLTLSTDKFSIADKKAWIIIQEALTNALDTLIDRLSSDQRMSFFKNYYLSTIDRLWIDHIDSMQHLRDKVGLYGYAQMDPLVMYKKEAFETFDILLSSLQQQTLQSILRIEIADQWLLIQSSKDISSGQHVVEILDRVKHIPQSPYHVSQKHTVSNSIDSDGTEVIDVTNTPIKTMQPISTGKNRPNDKVSVMYTDGRMAYDIKYKLVKDDIAKWICKIVI